MTQLVLSLGSNIDRDKHLCLAVNALRSCFGSLILSPVYESPAAGFDGPNFYNFVAVVETGKALEEVVGMLRHIESNAGRIRGQKRFQSRTLDIDILLFGESSLRGAGHDIPRAEIDAAVYVLKPLADILPDMAHPLSGRLFKDLWQDFSGRNQVLKKVELDCNKYESV